MTMFIIWPLDYTSKTLKLEEGDFFTDLVLCLFCDLWLTQGNEGYVFSPNARMRTTASCAFPLYYYCLVTMSGASRQMLRHAREFFERCMLLSLVADYPPPLISSFSAFVNVIMGLYKFP